MPREYKHRYCSLPTLHISLWIVALSEKIYNGDPILTVVSNIGKDVDTVVSIKSTYDVKVCRSSIICRYWKTIIFRK